jgi:hypothetical protein
MILNRYIAKTFALKLFYTISLAILASFLMDGIGSIGQCIENCSAIYQLNSAFFRAVIFVDKSIFFIMIISIIWFTVSISRTNQFVVIKTYTKKSTIFVKNTFISIVCFSFFYLTIFHSNLLPYMKNYIQINQNNENLQIEKIWINKIAVKNDITNGNLYMIKNVKKYLAGYSADSISIYTITSGYIQSYKRFERPFLAQNDGGSVVFIFKDKNETKRNTINDISINDISVNFGLAEKMEGLGFIESIFTLTLCDICSYNQKNTSKIIIIHALEKIISLILAFHLVFGELPMYHHRLSNGIGYKVFRVSLFAIICYTLPEMLKIVNNYTLNGYIASITLYIAMLCIFVRRLVKHHY